jgi:hypothetical protein
VLFDLASQATQTFIKGRATCGANPQSAPVMKLLEDLLGTDFRTAGFPREAFASHEIASNLNGTSARVRR